MTDLMLAHLPTRLERADRLGAALGLPPDRLWVKRDDCTGLATGGNKARKLELLVADALARGCDVLVTAGGPQSNHARSTAAAAARVGMGCVLAFNSDPPRRTESNQLLEVVFGIERRFLGPLAMDDLNAAVESIAGELRSNGPDGTPVHSLRTLLAEMATLTRNLVVPAGAPDEAAFEITATPTPLQARAFALLRLSPAGT